MSADNGIALAPPRALVLYTLAHQKKILSNIYIRIKSRDSHSFPPVCCGYASLYIIYWDAKVILFEAVELFCWYSFDWDERKSIESPLWDAANVISRSARAQTSFPSALVCIIFTRLFTSDESPRFSFCREDINYKSSSDFHALNTMRADYLSLSLFLGRVYTSDWNSRSEDQQRWRRLYANKWILKTHTRSL